jgi:hypothetical protein
LAAVLTVQSTPTHTFLKIDALAAKREGKINSQKCSHTRVMLVHTQYIHILHLIIYLFVKKKCGVVYLHEDERK